MGSMTFVGTTEGRRLSFDSSPQYSLPKTYGWVEGSLELSKEREDSEQIVYSVRARVSSESPEPVFVGTLFQKTRDAIWGQKGRSQ